jgi:hypothetical protein
MVYIPYDLNNKIFSTNKLFTSFNSEQGVPDSIALVELTDADYGVPLTYWSMDIDTTGKDFWLENEQ